MSRATLYGIAASHPTAAVEAALTLKGISYRRRDRIPVLHKLIHRLRFGQGTAPALALDGTRIAGSTRILAHLDEVRPAPALLPPETRDAILAAAEWDETVLQPAVRRLIWTSLRRHPGALRSYTAGHAMILPTWAAALSAKPLALIECRIHGAGEHRLTQDVAALPGLLDRADAELAGDGSAPTAAQLLIAASVALLATMEDAAGALRGRPSLAAAHARYPGYPGRMPAGTLPELAAIEA